jgi:hypothetical protein
MGDCKVPPGSTDSCCHCTNHIRPICCSQVLEEGTIPGDCGWILVLDDDIESKAPDIVQTSCVFRCSVTGKWVQCSKLLPACYCLQASTPCPVVARGCGGLCIHCSCFYVTFMHVVQNLLQIHCLTRNLHKLPSTAGNLTCQLTAPWPVLQQTCLFDAHICVW